MAAPFQQQSLYHKLIYFVLIVVFLIVAYEVRHADFTVASWKVQGVVAQAKALELREQDLGEADLTSSFLTLILTGSRGLVVCGLWWEWQDLMKRNEWNELEITTNVITKLQPHFYTPWLFQSWNLAYNVSVESERINDKYFYISRGIELLADGERRNRDHPDLRFHLGVYYQSKLGLSDEKEYFRCLFQLSSIDPMERRPERFRPNAEDRFQVNLDELQKFCEAHPQLIRRLREVLAHNTPKQIIDFLAENRKVPNRFEEPQPDQPATPLKPPRERFPVLPPPSNFDREAFNENSGELPDVFDNFLAARAWFSYSQDPLYLPQPRRVKQLATVLFQAYPARAQAYHAERLEDEGWFDDEGWEITDWFPPERSAVVVGRGNWARDAWEKAFALYQDYGERTGMLRTPERLAAMTPQEMRDYQINRNMTNFPHHYLVANVESQPQTIKARKLFFQAERLRKSGATAGEILKRYEHPDAFGPPSTWDRSKATGWKKILLEHPDFQQDADVQEKTYELQLKYLRRVEEARGPELRRWIKAVADGLVQGADVALTSPVGRLPMELWLPSTPLPVQGPFDDVDKKGQPLISPDAMRAVRSRLGLPTEESPQTSRGLPGGPPAPLVPQPLPQPR